MYTNHLSLGQVVRSTAGRDKGKLMVVVEIVDSQYVHVSDGDLRKLEKPKKKKIKHLAKTNHIISEIKELVEVGKLLNNAEIRKHVKKLV